MFKATVTLTVMVCLLTLGCQNQPAVGDSAEQAAKTVLYRYLEIFNDGNMDLVESTIDTAYVCHHPSYPDDIKGQVAFQEWVEMNRTAFSDFRLTLEDILAKDNDVYCRWTMTGTHDGPLRDLPPTGKKVSVAGLALTRMVDGKVAEEWVMFDIANLYRQLGYRFVPPEP